MVMGFRERRLGCRLYVDRQSDANILKKLDKLNSDIGSNIGFIADQFNERYRAGL